MGSWVFFSFTFQLLTPRGNMTLCLDHSTLSPLACSKTQNVEKKGGTWMDFSSSLGFYESDATFQGWVSLINFICDVWSCEN